MAKNFISNITTFMEELEPKWDYITKLMTLKNNKLSVSFTLKESGIVEEIQKLDKNQSSLDSFIETKGLDKIPADVPE